MLTDIVASCLPASEVCKVPIAAVLSATSFTRPDSALPTVVCSVPMFAVLVATSPSNSLIAPTTVLAAVVNELSFFV